MHNRYIYQYFNVTKRIALLVFVSIIYQSLGFEHLNILCHNHLKATLLKVIVGQTMNLKLTFAPQSGSTLN